MEMKKILCGIFLGLLLLCSVGQVAYVLLSPSLAAGVGDMVQTLCQCLPLACLAVTAWLAAASPRLNLRPLLLVQTLLFIPGLVIAALKPGNLSGGADMALWNWAADLGFLLGMPVLTLLRALNLQKAYAAALWTMLGLAAVSCALSFLTHYAAVPLTGIPALCLYGLTVFPFFVLWPREKTQPAGASSPFPG